jgi:hypothetical protein
MRKAKEDLSIPLNMDKALYGTAVRLDTSSHSKSSSKVPSLLCLPACPDYSDLLFILQLQWKWTYGADVPIVLLEALAFYTEYKFLCKQIENHSKRHFHVFDALGSMGAFAKGRSSSIRLNRICRKVTAMSILSDMTFYYAYTDSASQPMDEGSRIFPAGRRGIPRDFTT